MTKQQKVDCLYNMARGGSVSASEAKELKKYKVGHEPSATKKDLGAYVSAVDKGCKTSFYDWSCNNLRGDRRLKGNSKEEIKEFNQSQDISVACVGWLIWGLAIYWMTGGSMSVGGCAIAGVVVALILFKVARKWAAFTQLLLPAILAV